MRARPTGRRALARLRPGGGSRAGRRADADAPLRRTVLRRRGGDAAGDSRAVWRPDQPGLGDGLTQAILSVVRLRAPGRSDGRWDRAVAGTAAQLSPGVRLLDVARRRRPGAADTGGAAVADVRDALALERDPLADAVAQPGRQASPTGDPPDARARFDRLGLSGSDRLPGQPRRRGDRDPRSPA